MNCIRVDAGEGRGEGERAAPVGTNLQVCPPAACPPSTTRPLGRPPRPPTPALNGPRRFDQIARSRTPLGVQVVFGGRRSGGVASLDPRLISVIPTGIAGRDFVTPHDPTLFARHPRAETHPTSSRAAARVHHATRPPSACENGGRRRSPALAPTLATDSPPKLSSRLSLVSFLGRRPLPWYVHPLRVHPQQPLPWAAHDVHKHPP